MDYSPANPPEPLPLITQTPSGPIVEDNKALLTCEIIGGNPLATLFLQCDGFTPVPSTGILPTNKVVSSIEKIVTKEDRGKICTCSGQHQLWIPTRKNWSYDLFVTDSSTIQIANTQPIILVENKTIVLICTEVDGIPMNVSFVWYKSNTIVGTVANYSIREAKATDAGNYTCKGSSGFGRKSEAIIEVYVLYSPKVSVSSVTNRNTIAEDNTAVLQCTVQSNPPPNIVWTKHGSNAILHRTNNVFHSNLTIDNANCLDTGNYTCKAMNIINNDEYTNMKDIELFVKCSPRRYNGDDQSQNPIVIAIGETLTISQHIIAFPIAITSWIFKRNENSPETTVSSTSNCSTYNVIDQHICFSRHKLTATDFGLYSVVIVNDVGKARFTYNVIPEGQPMQPTNILVACETTSMIVSWRPGFNGGVKQSFNVVLLNNKTQQTQYSSDIMDSNHESSKQYIVKLLTPDTTYIIYVEATNSYGTVRSTDNDNCTTGSSLFNSQASNSLGTSVAAAIGTSVFILLVTSLVVFVLRRRRMKNKKEDNNLYQSTQPGTSRQRANNDEHDYSELQTKRMDCNPDGMQANSSTTYEEIGRINDGQIYQNVSKNKKDPLEIQNVSMIYANMNI
ncbi:neural cell adhesion molecule 1-B-like [Mytilus edulis]|uniref:neural cell adhesion molecule 1-B-like n=1 Tax=Mytilus edulis TaxID=6550 RepID=UPI0039EE15DF